MQEEYLDGTRGKIREYSPKGLLASLRNPKVKEVYVFKLETGMEIEIKGKMFRVERINSKGKETIVHLHRV